MRTATACTRISSPSREDRLAAAQHVDARGSIASRSNSCRPAIPAIHGALIQIHRREILVSRAAGMASGSTLQSLSYNRCSGRTARLGAEAGCTSGAAVTKSSPAFPQYTHRCDPQRPPERAVRAAQLRGAVARLDERRPRAAERAIAAIPVVPGSIVAAPSTGRSVEPERGARAARSPARQSATPDRAKTPCAVRWSASAF